jgi:hypothetical protein
MGVPSLRLAFFALLTLIASPAMASEITVTKTAQVISDPVNSAAPKSLPDAVVEYKLLARNPVGNAGLPVRNMVITDILPAGVALRVVDVGLTGKGPIEFIDGGVAGIGSSNLTYSYVALGNGGDGLEFWDGTRWDYTPVADSAGYDTNVRGIRVTLGPTFSTSGSFTLRYRVKIR